MITLSQKIEALLFLAGEAVTVVELARLLECSLEETRLAISELATVLHDRGLTLVITETHVQLTTSPAVSTYLQHFIQGEAQSLSNAAAETLALIAYRSPISRQEIEAIRGVDSRRMIRQLRLRGLVHITGHQGQFPLYSITPEFLQHLGITRREDLPRFTDLANTHYPV